MRIYGLKDLLWSLLFAAALIAYALWELRSPHGDRISAFLLAAFALYCIGRAVHLAFSKEAYEKEQRDSARRKALYRAHFGIFAPVMPYLGLSMVLLAAVLLSLVSMPAQSAVVLALGLLAASAVYTLAFFRWERRALAKLLAEEEAAKPPQ